MCSGPLSASQTGTLKQFTTPNSDLPHNLGELKKLRNWGVGMDGKSGSQSLVPAHYILSHQSLKPVNTSSNSFEISYSWRYSPQRNSQENN